MQALEEAEDNLVIDPHSRSLIEGAIQVESLRVRDVMVPKAKMVMIASDTSTEDLLQEMIRFCPFCVSRFTTRSRIVF